MNRRKGRYLSLGILGAEIITKLKAQVSVTFSGLSIKIILPFISIFDTNLCRVIYLLKSQEFYISKETASYVFTFYFIITFPILLSSCIQSSIISIRLVHKRQFFFSLTIFLCYWGSTKTLLFVFLCGIHPVWQTFSHFFILFNQSTNMSIRSHYRRLKWSDTHIHSRRDLE